MRTSDFDYDLPAELIAQTPAEPRDSSRLLVIHRESGVLEHRVFRDLTEYLRAGDLLVLNDSRVIPARLYGATERGARVELLLLRRQGPGVWQALVKPGRSMHPGARFTVTPAGGTGATHTLAGEVLSTDADGVRVVRIEPEDALEQHGQVPLPPYIHAPLRDPERYQTVYARVKGSVAAPTAGLHFTPALLEALRTKGVRFAFGTLHIGLDTFRPVQEDDPAEHKLHTEWWEMGQDAASELNAARREGRRIVAVGTTSVRVLEQAALEMHRAGLETIQPSAGWADLFILPGHKFRMVDALITNFHLPRSTLLMLVSAFAGRERVLAAYQEAIRQCYRFYSFGDAMLLL